MLRQIITVVALTIDVILARNAHFTPNDFKNVMTEGGIVRGIRPDNEDYFSFLGIPYAAPPTGCNRFKPPQPPLPWDGIYEANRTVICPQRGEGDENCLILNVFTPIKVPKDPLPVLVYVHGGSFLLGYGLTSGVGPLIKEDIVVVTMNYRLGALGFLCLNTEEAPGNVGLKDQVAALLWVRNNIRNFGGSPEDVTIYGMSAGGASVEYQVLSKMGSGLFKQAIVESGSATSVWAFDIDPIKTAMDVAELLDFPNTTNVNKIIDYYRSVPAKQLSKVNYDYYNSLTDGTFGFVPCAERESKKAFITEHPYDILTKEKYNKIPMLFMFATLEGLYLISQEYYEQPYRDRMLSTFLDFLPADLVFETREIKHDIAEKIKHFYFGNRFVGEDIIIEHLNYFGDSLILNSLLNSAEIHSKGNPVFLMEFAYKGEMGSYEEFFKDINIAGHGDIIKHAILNRPIKNESDKLAVDRVSKLIANFVSSKFGNPTPITTQLLPILWPPVQPNNVTCLHFDRDFQIIKEPHWDRKIFWDQLYTKYRRRTMNFNKK